MNDEQEKYRISIGQFAANLSTEALINQDFMLYHEDEGYYSGLIGIFLIDTLSAGIGRPLLLTGGPSADSNVDGSAPQTVITGCPRSQECVRLAQESALQHATAIGATRPLPRLGGLDQGFQHVKRDGLGAVADSELVALGEFFDRRHEPRQ